MKDFEDIHGDPRRQGAPTAKGHGQAVGGSSASNPHMSTPAMSHGSQHQATPAGVGIADLWLVVRRWGWKCASAGLVLAVGACAVVWLVFKPTFEASAWLEIRQQPFVLAYEPRQESLVFGETQLQTMRSPVVLSPVGSDPKFAELPEALKYDSPLLWLQKNLKVNFVGRSELCEVKFSSRRADTAANVANAVVKTYLSLHTDSQGEMNGRILKLLKDEKLRREEEVRSAQQRVKVLTNQATEDDPTMLHQGQNQIIMPANGLTASEERRTAAQVEIAVLTARLEAYQESVGEETVQVSEGELALALEKHPEIQSLRIQLAGLRAKLRQHVQRSSRGDSDPEPPRIRKEIEELQEAVTKATDELRPVMLDEIRGQVRNDRLQEIAELQRQIADQRLLEGLWEKRIADHRKKLEKLGDKAVDLQFARNDLKNSDEVLTKITQRMTAMKTEMEAPSRAWLKLSATAPEKPVQTVPYKQFAVAGLASFALPLGLAFLWERWVRRIHDAGQLAKTSNLPVLGEITVLPARYAEPKRRSDDRFARDRATFQESIDALRVALLLSPEMHGLQTLVVSSAISREGKTSLASSLAASIAKNTGEPTLLVDADVRCPSLHEIFDVSLAPGLTEVLTHQCPLADAIVHTDGQPLDLLPAGQLRSTPHALFQRGKLLELLGDVRSKYRYVIIDSPPVLAASEALVLASAADGTLICTMRDLSRGSQFSAACDRLAGVGARLVGTVISGIPTQKWAYKYGGYGYGWKNYASSTLSLEDEDGKRKA